MTRITHWRHEEPTKDEVGMVACGLPNTGIWSDHRRKRVTCDACLNLPKD